MKTLTTYTLLFAWLCAQGVLWDIAQAVVWGKMFVEYTQTESLGDSLRLTFDAERPCHLCLSLQEIRQKQNSFPESENEWERDGHRLLLGLPAVTHWHPNPSLGRPLTIDLAVGQDILTMTDLPPPRIHRG
ncbi:MAG: hypothetical protein LAT55_13340 [Opitutales bacterium]|nr:hypothetical protein [Opitutales bacterium]